MQSHEGVSVFLECTEALGSFRFQPHQPIQIVAASLLGISPNLAFFREGLPLTSPSLAF